MDPQSLIIVVMGVGVPVFALGFFLVYASHVVQVRPDEALVVTGRSHAYRMQNRQIGYRGFKIVRGGRCFVWPVFERSDRLSLAPFTVEIDLGDGRRATLQAKIGGDVEAIAAAAECFLSKSPDEIAQIVRELATARLHAGAGETELSAELAKRGLELMSLRKSEK
ncbi:MAG TPA: hypothetical protein VI643_01380 [Planctomycetota bacterium]|nr:hypothetical protein [Planctomycetota bacterium]